ncbi:TIGR04255 family protein [Erwiniaceae bacterium BAC15a-03b]|uniref:TIGR04255 family protein n=1 Tax=Winslowiella arboricola TaxID=2978220 RepID=A0A9J6PHL5_9GAMM|nr:TIGR04255 family protein [Winslowiella arboricola]MCU5773088.1 TIGR04255 family protein [Winslowiella arboricola]MCU5777817.1 TIGR04255 family protein [Winslowiella arboricola]
MGNKMSNAPVYYALAQAKFNVVQVMHRFVDEIQDLLRRHGYTLFEEQSADQLQFVFNSGEEAPQPKVIEVRRWLFTKADRSSGFILENDSIAFQTTHYETHSEFFQELMTGLFTVHKVVSLEHVSRLGIRYLDAVLPVAGENVDMYLVDGLQGVQAGARQLHALNEYMYETEVGPLIAKGTLVLRVHKLTGELSFPPDIQPQGLKLKDKFINTGKMHHAIIDTDHYVEAPIALTNDNGLREQLDVMHGEVKTCFFSMLKPHAQQTWE